MKKLLPFLLLLLWQITFSSMADETNQYYYTYEGSENLSEGSIDSKKIEEAKRSRESLPAGEFPEGNWGEPFHGIQLSLRFDKKVYTNGEPVSAILLVRNVTNHFINVAGSIRTGGNGLIGFVVTNSSSCKLSSKWEKPAGPGEISFVGGHDRIPLATQVQCKLHERLDKIYDLTNDTYLVQATLDYPLIKRRSPEGRPLELEWKQITSALVEIKIEGSP